MIRVLLVDDDPAVLEGLRQLLSLAEGVEVVGEATDAGAACEVGQQLLPDVVVIDADLPRASCLETMRQLGSAPERRDRQPSFVCLAVYPDQHDAALQLGATRFLRKDGSARELVGAIREASQLPGRQLGGMPARLP